MKAAPIVALALIALLAAACNAELTFVAPWPATIEGAPAAPLATPGPAETPTPAPTVRPSPTPAPTLAAGEPVILALIPLRDGATWVYSVTLDYQDGYRPVRWTGVITETITAAQRTAETIGNGRIFRAERAGAFPLETPPHEPTFFYVALGGWLYQIFDAEDSPDQIRDLIEAQGRGFEAERIAAWPMTVGQTWGDPDLISVEGTTYRWLVEAQEDVLTPAAGGIARLDCFRLVFRTNPDVTIQWYCPGAGLVRYQYHHNGSLHDEVWELLRHE